jgi:hypothetical protein
MIQDWDNNEKMMEWTLYEKKSSLSVDTKNETRMKSKALTVHSIRFFLFLFLCTNHFPLFEGRHCNKRCSPDASKSTNQSWMNVFKVNLKVCWTLRKEQQRSRREVLSSIFKEKVSSFVSFPGNQMSPKTSFSTRSSKKKELERHKSSLDPLIFSRQLVNRQRRKWKCVSFALVCLPHVVLDGHQSDSLSLELHSSKKRIFRQKS